MEPITPVSRVNIDPEVLFSQVGDEAVLLHLKSGVYYSLDAVGALVWAEIAAGKPLGDIHVSLTEQFVADSDVVWADLKTLVEDLMAKGLVTVLQVEE